MSPDELLELARHLIAKESRAIMAVANTLDYDFVTVAKWISEANGNIYVSGAGTSGTIATRLAHLLATCGIKAFALNPCDALHGESRLLGEQDVLLAFSKAGKSEEINALANIARDRSCKVVGFTWDIESEFGKLCDIVVDINSGPEAEGAGILPFGSTLTAGAVADALCLLVIKLTEFDLSDIVSTHPSGGVKELLNDS